MTIKERHLKMLRKRVETISKTMKIGDTFEMMHNGLIISTYHYGKEKTTPNQWLNDMIKRLESFNRDITKTFINYSIRNI